MIERIIKEIESSLKHENYMAALSLALTLPDICGKAEYPNEGNGRRYIQWFDEYLGKYEIPPDVHDKENPSRIVNDTMPYMSGEIVYSLRNCFLHQGTPSIDKGKIREPRCQVTHFVLTIAGATNGGSSCIERNCFIDGERRTLEINLVNLCCKLYLVAKSYYEHNKEKFDFFQYELQDRRIDGVDLLWGLNILE